MIYRKKKDLEITPIDRCMGGNGTVRMEKLLMGQEEMLGKGIASRFGGEEFMLVFEEDNREQVLQAFQNIQEGLRKYSQATKQTDITISGGMERYEADKQMDLLFTSADRKLYTAKNNGKNRIVE